MGFRDLGDYIYSLALASKEDGAPIVKPLFFRDVYLPAGTWKDFWSGRIYRGGQTLKGFPAPLEVLPVFVDVR